MEIILCETIRYDTDKRNSLFGESVQLATYRLYCYHYLITSLPIYCYGSRGRAAVGRSALLIAFEYPASGGWPPNTRYPLPLSAAILSAFKRRPTSQKIYICRCVYPNRTTFSFPYLTLLHSRMYTVLDVLNMRDITWCWNAAASLRSCLKDSRSRVKGKRCSIIWVAVLPGHLIVSF